MEFLLLRSRSRCFASVLTSVPLVSMAKNRGIVQQFDCARSRLRSQLASGIALSLSLPLSLHIDAVEFDNRAVKGHRERHQ